MMIIFSLLAGVATAYQLHGMKRGPYLLSTLEGSGDPDDSLVAMVLSFFARFRNMTMVHLIAPHRTSILHRYNSQGERIKVMSWAKTHLPNSQHMKFPEILGKFLKLAPDFVYSFKDMVQTTWVMIARITIYTGDMVVKSGKVTNPAVHPRSAAAAHNFVSPWMQNKCLLTVACYFHRIFPYGSSNWSSYVPTIDQFNKMSEQDAKGDSSSTGSTSWIVAIPIISILFWVLIEVMKTPYGRAAMIFIVTYLIAATYFTKSMTPVQLVSHLNRYATRIEVFGAGSLAPLAELYELGLNPELVKVVHGQFGSWRARNEGDKLGLRSMNIAGVYANQTNIRLHVDAFVHCLKIFAQYETLFVIVPTEPCKQLALLELSKCGPKIQKIYKLWAESRDAPYGRDVPFDLVPYLVKLHPEFFKPVMKRVTLDTSRPIITIGSATESSNFWAMIDPEDDPDGVYTNEWVAEFQKKVMNLMWSFE